MATVLILATDRMIGDLLGQLTDLTGHAAQFRLASEEPSESVRHARPDVLMLDAAYGQATTELIADSAREVGVPIVYFGAAIPASELRRFALERGAKYFALPAGPKLLSRVLTAALDTHGAGQGAKVSSIADYAVTAASAAVARARALVDQSRTIGSEVRHTRGERDAALADSRRSYAELREAVIAYTRELRAGGVPPDRTLEMIKSALGEGAQLSGSRHAAGSASDSDIADAVEWCLQAYYAA
jgi:DNA-binding response OmpR family regulator